jgi:hypothetical protein
MTNPLDEVGKIHSTKPEIHARFIAGGVKRSIRTK